MMAMRKALLLLCALNLPLGVGTLSSEESIAFYSPKKNAKTAKIEPSCRTYSRSDQITVRHAQGTGIGYEHGYTTLEGFLSPRRCHSSWVPFADLRGHVFNNGTFAANAGLGVRYVGTSTAWGMNAYYDYRNTNRFHYNQVSAGLEAIGSFWMVNLNGYLPVGKTQSRFFNPTLLGAASFPTFAFFQGNHLFITLSGTQELVADQEFAFKGIDANATFRVLDIQPFSIDVGVGPYYFHGAYSQFAAGGKANVTARWTDYVAVGLTGSYDNLFRERGQVEIAVSIPFGAKSFGKKCSALPPCEVSSFYDLTLARGVKRNEIIVLDDLQKTLAHATPGGTEVAINPRTGQPYLIWFVNNQSHSAGTFEDPFTTIQDALLVAQEEDVIYVYEGMAPYDAAGTAFMLLDNQWFFGSGVAQFLPTTVGTIEIPAQTVGYPTIENTAPSTILTVGNQDVVSGFQLIPLSADSIVIADTIQDLSFLSNRYTATISGSTNLSFNNCFGNLLVQNNQFNMAASDTSSFGVFLQDSGNEQSNLSILGNTFANHGGSAIDLAYTGPSSPTLNIASNQFSAPAGSNGTGIALSTSMLSSPFAGSISQNTFTDYGFHVIEMSWDGSGAHALSISENSIASDPTASSTFGINLSTSADNSALSVSDNQLLNQSGVGLNCFALGNAAFAFAVTENTITAVSFTGSNGIQINGKTRANMAGFVSNNVCSNHQNNGINFFVEDDAIVAATIDHNRITVPENLGGIAGIQVNLGNTSTVTSTYVVTNNICTGHIQSGIQSFPRGSSQLFLTISNNTLTSATAGIAMQNPEGITLDTSDQSALLSALIANNTWTGPATYSPGTVPQGIQIGINNDSICSNLVVTGNKATLPLLSYQTLSNPVGINVGTSNNGTLLSALISQNTVLFPNANYIADASPEGIQIFLNGTSVLAGALISQNTITFAPQNSSTLTNFFPNGIQIGASNTAVLGTTTSPLLVLQNTVVQTGGQGINLFASQTSSIVATVAFNTVTAPSNGSNTSGIGVGCTDNTSCDYTVINNTCTGQSNGCIQSFPNGFSQISLNISNNSLMAATDGITTAGAVGVQVNPNQNATLLSALIAGNTWKSPSTYQADNSPQGISVSVGDTTPGTSPTGTNIVISGNNIVFPITSYPLETGVLGISLSAYGNGVVSSATVTSNSITYPLSAYYTASTSLQGIQVGVGNSGTLSPGSSMQNVVISQNTISFAPLLTSLVSFSNNGIGVSAGDPMTSLGTLLSPILIDHNTMTNIEGNGISLTSGSDNDVYIVSSSNSVSLGALQLGTSPFGILSFAAGNGQLVVDIDGNRIEGNNAGFGGIATINASGSCQQATIQNNLIQNVHAMSPIPIPGVQVGGGIIALPLGPAFFSVLVKNNTLIGNTPQGILGLATSEISSANGSLCISIEGNQGPDGYTLFLDPAMPTPTLSYFNDGMNTGTFTISAGVITLTVSCPSCP
jgi:hypothetical protein